MRKKILILLLLFVSNQAFSQTTLSGYFQSFATLKSDEDFDPSKSIYEPWGQTSGAIGTYSEPQIKVSVGNTIISAEPLLGFNLWSRNSPFSRPDEKGGNQIIFLLRQLYSETDFTTASLRIGYQYFADPIGIFIRHWIGGAELKINNKFQIFIGQIPDQTFEGIDFLSNNFINDVYVFSFNFVQNRAKNDINVLPLAQSGLFAGIYNLFDNSIINKPLFLSAIVAGYGYDTDKINITGGVAFQGGIGFKRAEKLKNENILAGAVEITARTKGKFPIGGEIMILSPDNTDYRDNINTAFLYSGKSLSRTILLTEDEIIFKSDNLDLNTGESISVFQNIRPGFGVLDFWIEIPASDFWKITPVVGGAFSLMSKNSSLGNSISSNLFGIEITPIISYRKDNLLFDFAYTLLVPGDASTTFVNSINPYRKRNTIHNVELSLKIIF